MSKKTELENENNLIQTEPAAKSKKMKTLTAEQVEKAKKPTKSNPRRTITGKRIKPLKGEARARVTRFNTTIKNGLSDEQLDLRQQQGLVNNSNVKTTKSYGAIIFGNIFTFFNILCFIVIGSLIAVGQWKNLAFSAIFLQTFLLVSYKK